MVTKNTHPGSRSSRGFTLMEVMLAIIIVGVGIVAMLMLFGSGTRVNKCSSDLATSVFLADQLRSMTDELDFDTLPGMDNQAYNGVDASGDLVTGLQNFQQRLVVQTLNPDDLTISIVPDPEALLLTARVTKGGVELASISWLRMK